MLNIPNYIEDSGVVGVPANYKWEVAHQVVLMDKVSKNMEKAIHGISCNATFALDLAIGEWLLWRLHGLADYEQVYYYVEALWASTIDELYLKEEELPTPEYREEDPVYGALYGLEQELYNVTTNALLNHPERAKTAAGLVSFVRYTLPKTEPFDSWLKKTIKQLSENFRYDKENPQGVIIPRAFMDPDVKPDESTIPSLLDNQLRSIEYSKNPFLNSPDEMKASGFTGEPYRYST